MKLIYCEVIDEYIELVEDIEDVEKQAQFEELEEREANPLISGWDFVW